MTGAFSNAISPPPRPGFPPFQCGTFIYNYSVNDYRIFINILAFRHQIGNCRLHDSIQYPCATGRLKRQSCMCFTPAKAPYRSTIFIDLPARYSYILCDRTRFHYLLLHLTRDDLSEPACPLYVLVGENSPSLCPTIFSVTYTGKNFFPLYTLKV